MPSNDARNLLQTAVPTAAVGAIVVAVSAGVAGGKGALGAAVGTLLAILFMGIGLYVLQWTAKTLPQLFQAMGLMLYVAQLLLLLIFVAVFKDTTLEASAASKLAIALAKGENPPSDLTLTSIVDPVTKKDVKSVLETPKAIYKDNVKDVVTAGGVTAAELCAGAYAAKCTAAGIS